MLEYKIHVINRDLNFDKTYKNVIQFFNTADNTKDYTGVFTNDELSFTDAEETINFDLFDSINASVVLDTTSESAPLQFNDVNININKALNRQYCIIQEKEKDDNGNTLKTNLYFYFIDKAIIKNEYLVRYDLILDVFTTHPLFSDVDVDKTKITRAHTDRFASGSTLSSATFNLNNKFLETGEPIDDAYIKIRKSKQNASFKNICGTNYQKLSTASLSNEILNEIINNTRWLYVVARATKNNYLRIAPYYPKKSNYTIKYYVSHTIDYTNDGHLIDADFLYNDQAESADVYNAYISPFAPFGTINNNINNYRIAYSYDNLNNTLDIIFLCEFEPLPDGFDNYVLYNSYEIENADSNITRIEFFVNALARYIYLDYSQLGDAFKNFISYFESEDITLFNSTITNLSNVYNYTDIQRAEIKTKMRMSYNEYTLKSQFDTAETAIDLNILKTTTLKIKVLNNLNPANDGDVFITINDIWKKNFGITSKVQYTPLFYSDKFREYVATNKNYRITGQAIPILSATAGGAVGGAVSGLKIGGVYGGAIGAVAGGIIGFGSSAFKVHTNFDNMLNTPDAIKLKGQNITIDEKITPSYVYIENNGLRDEDEKAVNYYFYEYGYNISIIDNIKNYFTRRDFNYIQLDDCEKDIHALLNEDILKTIITALNNGVRFWSKTKYIDSKFSYTTNNLESKLT